MAMTANRPQQRYEMRRPLRILKVLSFGLLAQWVAQSSMLSFLGSSTPNGSLRRELLARRAQKDEGGPMLANIKGPVNMAEGEAPEGLP
eukprot:6473864-Amphidinium_carterae.1